MNRLAHEASPYLQQHATNPVDWFPWGPEALEHARREDKPILLSIGYSACHWCHVMERECFEDRAIAERMNALFVNVKVDREERPDLDQVYQLVVQLLGQGGGWPLTVFLTPDQRPFFAGTYFPPHDKYGRPGFPRVLEALADAYREKRDEVTSQAQELTAAITQATAIEARGGPGAALGPDLVARAAARLGDNFDDVHGGFGTRPKFPNTMSLEVLLHHALGDLDETSGERVRRALDGMASGGICDQLGGGFHRYSTDERWLVPHFEKMLYDNALLLRLYVDAYRAFGAPEYAATARAIARYVEREMTDASGGFYAAQDADSEGEEGRFFVWSADEVNRLLSGDREALEAALAHWDIAAHGNFEDSGDTVLSIVRPAAGPAIERARQILFEAREKRPKPFRDEKILASWNALMIGALAEASVALSEPPLLVLAERAFAFVEEKMLVAEGADALRVLRHTKDGVVKGPGFLDDVGFMACAALDLYDATGKPRYVEIAGRIVTGGVRHFADAAEADFFFAPDDGEKLLVRATDPFDHAIPSGVSMLVLAMLRLETLRGDDAAFAHRAIERMASAALRHPLGMSQTIAVLDRKVRGSVDVVLVGRRDDPRTRALAATVFAAPLLSRTVAWLDPNDESSRAACRALGEGKVVGPNGTPCAYVCRGQTCSLPVTTAAELQTLLSAR
jgi:uncharacterized protein YyaL (SSP411 family)